MSTTNIWVNGPNPEKAAIERAREIGYKDPHVARTVTIQGTRSALVGVVVAEGEQEAATNREARRRGRGTRQNGENGNGNTEQAEESAREEPEMATTTKSNKTAADRAARERKAKAAKRTTAKKSTAKKSTAKRSTAKPATKVQAQPKQSGNGEVPEDIRGLRLPKGIVQITGRNPAQRERNYEAVVAIVEGGKSFEEVGKMQGRSASMIRFIVKLSQGKA